MEENNGSIPKEREVNEIPNGSTAVSQPLLSHNRVLAPLDTSLRPEDAGIPVRPAEVVVDSTLPVQTNEPTALYPTEATEGIVNAPAGTIEPPLSVTDGEQHIEVQDEKKYWVGKVIKLIVSAVIGFISTAIYAFDLEAGSVLNRASIITHHYGPIVLGYTAILTIISAGMYAVILRFILRSRFSVGQSAYALVATQLLVLVVFGVVHFGDYKLQIYSLYGQVIPAAIIAVFGAILFALASYISNKVWTWRISRTVLAVASIAVLFVASLGVSQLSGRRASSLQQAEVASSEKAQKDADVGVYNFDGGYQQFYLKETAQSRFEISKIAAVNDEANSPANKPHYTSYTILDTSNDRVSFTLWQTKANIEVFNPPHLCDNTDPAYSNERYADEPSIYAGVCNVVMAIDGVGTLYGRDHLDTYASTNAEGDTTRATLKAYEWYYVQIGDTLLTINDLHKTLGTEGAVALFSGLVEISPSELLEVSKSSTITRTAASTSEQLISFPLFMPRDASGLSLKGSFNTNKGDPANPVVLLKYDNASPVDSVGFSIFEYKTPQAFSPPHCGYIAPGIGIAFEACKLVGTTSSGMEVYSEAMLYWANFGETVICLDGLPPSSDVDALQIYESMASTPASSFNLQ